MYCCKAGHGNDRSLRPRVQGRESMSSTTQLREEGIRQETEYREESRRREEYIEWSSWTPDSCLLAPDS
jgi:hypothetical protein